MDEMTDLQQRWIDAARRRDAPSTAVARRVRRGLLARIEAGEAGAASLPATDPAGGGGSVAGRGGPWLLGGVGLLVAAGLLLWTGGVTTRQEPTDERSAAGYEAHTRDAAPTLRPGGRRGTVGAKRAVEVPGRKAHSDRAFFEQARVDTIETEVVGTARRTAAASCDASSSSTSGPSRAGRGSEPKRDRAALVPQPTGPPAPTRTPSALDVSGEVAVLRRVKQSLERGDWARADATLEEYDRSYPRGVLSAEARALRVVVACRRDAPNASARADRFLRAHPSSPLRERLRGACGLGPAP